MTTLISIFFCVITSIVYCMDEVSIPQYEETENQPPSLVNITSLPSAIVNGSVNVITGDYMESDIVYSVSGPDPYVLGHTYASSSLEEGTLGNGWNFAHYHFLQVKQPEGINFARDAEPDWIIKSQALLAGDLLPRGARRTVVKNDDGIKVHKKFRHEEKNPYTLLFLTEPSGGRLIFKGNGWARKFEAITENTGFTNVAGNLSAQTNIKNIYARWHAESDRFHVTFGDGTRRIYARQWRTSQYKHIHGHHAKYYRDYHLVHEVKPSGNHVHYTYNDRFEIVKIITYNRDYSKTINWIRFFQKPSTEFRKDPSLHIQTSDNQNFVYNFTKLKNNNYAVLGVKKPKRPYTRFIYSENPIEHKRRVIKKETEDGNYLETKYTQKGKVRLQKGPVGPNGERRTTHTYYYHKDGKEAGHTNVFDVLGARTRYYWDEQKRLTRVIRYNANKELVKKERFIWGSGKKDGYLIAHTIFDEENKPKFSRTFTYDKKGNVTEEKLFGRFTENRGAIRLEKGMPKEEGVDVLTTSYCYSDNEFNLKTSECDTQGNFIYYEYLEGTNLLTAKFVCDKKKVVLREFYTYDANGIAIETIVDDGSSKDKNNLQDVTERHYTLVTPRTICPHFGEPEVIEEHYYDFEKKCKVLLKRRVNHFSDLGFVMNQELYDANGKLSAIVEFEHDKVGRITKSQDPDNRVERFQYTKAGFLKRHETPTATLHMSYDALGRIVKKTEEQKEGATLTVRYQYDLLGRKIAEINPCGHKTSYEYDVLNRITKITYPKIYDVKGRKLAPTKKFEHKKLGTKRIATDENGYSTILTYNALGQPFAVYLQDGTKRSFTYDKRGNCIKQIAPHGVVEDLSYDVLNRKTKSKMSVEGKTLSKNKWRYSSFHLVEEVGPTGERVVLTYDPAGRKIKSELKGDTSSRKTCFFYDAFGRLEEEQNFHTKSKYVSKKYTYDQMHRVTSECISDDKENVHTYTLFSYDIDGNRSEVTTPTMGQFATTKTKFLAHGMPSKQQDALGNTWFYFYDYACENIQGQRVFKKITVNPLGVSLHEIFDTHGNVAEVSTVGAFGELLAHKEQFYDAVGNCVAIHEHAIVQGKSVSVIKTRLFYGPNRRLEKIVEAAGTSEAKTTEYHYNEFGQKEYTRLSDGVKTFNLYDSKGRVASFYADDHSFGYQYKYDASNRILSVKNNLTGLITERSYNDLGELVSETLETHLTVRYVYDGLARPTEITLPDDSKIEYGYAGSYLQSVQRRSSKDKVQWQHEIMKRDISGKALVVSLPGRVGTVESSYDLLGRKVSLQHPNFSQNALEFDAVGNLLKLSTKDEIGTINAEYSYDPLSQLVEERGHVAHTYSYNSLYDRLNVDDNRFRSNSLHSILSDTKHHFRYDEHGNRIEMDSTLYRYDALDRLIEVEIKGGETISYSYDAFDRRLQKKVYDASGKRTERKRFVYLGQNEIGTVDENDEITELRVLGEGLGAEIGAAIAVELEGELFVPLHDLRGNVVALLDSETGKSAESYRYDAFGNEESSVSHPKNPWRFSSKRVDSETGLSFFGRRYYDPQLGNWLTMDPLGLKAGPNLYAYVLNSPMTHFDLYGLIEEAEVASNERTWTERAIDFAADACRRVRDLLCKVGEEIVHNIPHIGNLNNKIEDGLRKIRGAEPKDRAIRLELVAPASPTANPKEAALYTAGMHCSSKGAIMNGQALAELYGPEHPDIYAFTVPENGFCMEWIRAILNMANIATPDIAVLESGLKDLSGKYDKIYASPHSLGGQRFYLATRGFSADEKQKFTVKSVGSAHQFSDEEGFAEARNCCARSDFVPIVSNVVGVIYKYIRGKGNMQFVGSAFKVPLSSHPYQSREYSDWTRGELQRFGTSVGY